MEKRADPEMKCPELFAPEDDDIISLNVGGSKFMTHRATIRKVPGCRLADDNFLNHYYSETLGEYFFDRDPDMFKATLNYMRSGELHLPSYICGPAAKAEMEFWGIIPNKIEQCCWMNYNEWNSTQEALKRLEHDRKMNLSAQYTGTSDASASCWEKLRPMVWIVLNRSNYNLLAKIIGVISLIFVLASIFSFLAETTQPFDYYIANPNQPTNVTSQVQNNASLPVNSSSPANSTTANASNVTTPVETIDMMKVKHPALYYMDLFCMIYFLLEYIVRFIFAPKKLKYAISLLAVIDIIAILPDVIELLVYHIKPELQADVDAVNYITILRVMRVLRVFRLVRHSPGLWILVYTLRASFSELVLLVWFVGIGMLVFSSLIYYVESREHFKSIPDGFWWALITMTTVGYGDMYPHSALGKLVGSVCAMSGVLMIGFTVPALVNNFMLYYRHVQFAVFCEETQHQGGHESDASEKSTSSKVSLGLSEKQSGLSSYCSSEKKSQNGGSDLEAPLMAKLHV